MSNSETTTDTLDPKQLEQTLIDEANKKAEDRPPEEIASMMFAMYLPRFFTQVDTLSNKDLRRLVKALVETPLNDEPYKFHSPAAKEAFNIGVSLLDSKYVMIMHTYSEGNNLEKLHEAATSEVDTSLDNTQEEVNENGV